MTTIDRDSLLSPQERATLDAVCETLLPALAPEAGDDPELFGLHAAGLGVAGVAGEIERVVGGMGAAQRTDFRRLLRLLAQPAFLLPLAGRARPFAALPPARRERALLAMATSRLEPLRTGFQVLKRLATLLFYSLCPEGGDNPTWRAIGYVRSPALPPPPNQPSLCLTPIAAPAALEADVCVIGSGAGGCVAAAELAAAGRRVVVLEAGGGPQAPDFDQVEINATRTLFLDGGVAATRDLGIAIMAGATLGGGTTVNWQTSLALPAAVREEWAELSGCAFFAEESFSRSLDAVVQRLGADTPQGAVNANNAVLRNGCRELGWRWQQVARNARGCDERQCGYCIFGCRHGGKQTAATTFLVDAQARGDTRILTGCRALRVLWSGGRVRGVEAVAMPAAGAAGAAVAVEVRAPTVVVAAGSLCSPALLLRSGLELPALGRHLHLHPATGVAGTFTSLIEPWCGPPQSILCDEFAGAPGGDGYGFRLETAPAHPGLLAMATPWCGARDHRREMQASARKCTLIVIVRDRTSGRVGVDRDGAPVVDYRPGRQEREQLRRGIAAASRALLAAGARQLLALNHRRLGLRAADDPVARQSYFDSAARCRCERNWSTLFSAHQMGTCRMGAGPRTAVCDAGGEVFGVRGLYVADASAFPASSGVNPMVTIMALAHHTAQQIKARTGG
ncbi:MAG TPA: GMC family oxidoreductase N-terminal domain-containing protein [Thermoanaerobaculia bacterium]|jgi:choline dehydrogenase-like flavoprotein|nr:GMC family oxidoreductase N-terminal domain-containing protein [Thermoanaerobaculia bacterium]